ncbi:MAG: hypothetical protein ACP5RF_00445 [Candidatus Micrarchaeia archaeon]
MAKNVKVTISLPKEINEALDMIKISRGGNSKPEVIKGILRDNNDVKRYIAALKEEKSGGSVSVAPKNKEV